MHNIAKIIEEISLIDRSITEGLYRLSIIYRVCSFIIYILIFCIFFSRSREGDKLQSCDIMLLSIP